MKINIVIPNYNGKKLLEKNLPSVITAMQIFGKDANQIVVVDDASDDLSIAYLKSQKKVLARQNIELVIHKNNRNYGFSTTVNRGVSYSSGDIVVLLNTDVSPDKYFLKPLLQNFIDETVFAVGCLDKSHEHGTIVKRGRGIAKWKRGLLFHSAGKLDRKETLWASGGSSAFRRKIWRKLGGMNELYNPFYWEDVDLSYRAWKSGYRILFEKESIVNHEHEIGSIKSHYSKSKIDQIAYRNQFIFVWENATDLSLQFSHGFWLFFYHLPKAIVSGNWPLIKGFLAASLLLPKILQSSFTAQKKFIRSDKEVVRQFTQ